MILHSLGVAKQVEVGGGGGGETAGGGDGSPIKPSDIVDVGVGVTCIFDLIVAINSTDGSHADTIFLGAVIQSAPSSTLY